MPWYRLQVSWVYSANNQANSANSAINSTLASLGYPDTATKSGTSVDLVIDNLTTSQAIELRDALTPGWSAGTRVTGKASIALRDEGAA